MVPKRKTKQVVEIDNRLTDLFHARKAGADASGDSKPDVSEPTLIEKTDDNISWLNQFKVMLGPEETQTDSTTKKSASTYIVSLKGIRPFWARENPKEMSASWKRSKKALMQDCQKQRKAALRKTIRR